MQKDGLHRIIYMQCGKIRVRVNSRELKQNEKMEHIVIVQKTNYKYICPEENEKIQKSITFYYNNPSVVSSF